MLFSELLLPSRGIGADTYDIYSPVAKRLEFVPESLAFDRSTGSAGLWEEPHHKPVALKIAQRYKIAIGVGKGEIRGLVACCQHNLISLH